MKYRIGFLALLMVSNLSYAANNFNIYNMQKKLITKKQISHIFNIDNNYQLKEKVSIKLKSGITKSRFDVYYKKIPVWNSVVTATNEKNKYKNISGSVTQKITNDLRSVTPSISIENILEKLKKQVPLFEQAAVKNIKNKLYILNDSGKAKLAYLVSFLIEGKRNSRPFIFVDANNGEIIKQWDALAYEYEPAVGPGGNEKTGRYQYGTDYGPLNVSRIGEVCTMENDRTRTINMNHRFNATQAYQFLCPENTVKEINGAYSPLNDGHFFANIVADMFHDWYRKGPLQDKLVTRVHFYQNYDNAFWNGSSMTFGDGFMKFYPLVSLNVVAHEAAHGFTEQHSDLVYANQSGGVNEAFSDISGEAAEYYMHGAVDWKVGADITKTDEALRYFADPTQDGKSIAHADNYIEGMNVHHSSGIFNHAFYLLSHTDGWDIKKAFDIFVRANQLYWSQEATFDLAAHGVAEAAADLGYQPEDVCEAFSQVGVYACGDHPTPPYDLYNDDPIMVTGDKNQHLFFKVNVPDTADSLTVTADGGGADLYVSGNKYPTMQDYDCHDANDNGFAACKLDLKDKAEAPYYVMLRGIENYDSVELKAVHDGHDSTVNRIIDGHIRSSQFYKFYSSGGSKIISISAGSGDADLYVKHDSQVSYTSYDCRPFIEGNEEVCQINKPGMYYIMVYAYKKFSGVHLRAGYNS